jgi:hypothetical protein
VGCGPTRAQQWAGHQRNCLRHRPDGGQRSHSVGIGPSSKKISSFSEEKEAKRLYSLAPRSADLARAQANKSFLVLFFKKEPLHIPPG